MVAHTAEGRASGPARGSIRLPKLLRPALPMAGIARRIPGPAGYARLSAAALATTPS
jgi:hypothetical protein